VQLLCDLIDRWHKRGGANIQRLDPELVDADEWDELRKRFNAGASMDDSPARSQADPKDAA